MGANGNHIFGPWRGIGNLLSRDAPSGRPPSQHPSRAVLGQYLGGSLPQRPAEWTLERAEALRRGRVADWTSWEVAAHLAQCPRCRARLEKHGTGPVGAAPAWTRWLAIVRSPRLAPVGWSLAGAQAIAIVALVLWANSAKPPTAPLKPVTLPDVNQMGQLTSSLPLAAVKVRFVASTDAATLTETLQELGIRIYGPDVEGYYTVVATEDGSETAEELRTSPLVEDVKAEGGR